MTIRRPICGVGLVFGATTNRTTFADRPTISSSAILDSTGSYHRPTVSEYSFVGSDSFSAYYTIGGEECCLFFQVETSSAREFGIFVKELRSEDRVTFEFTAGAQLAIDFEFSLTAAQFGRTAQRLTVRERSWITQYTAEGLRYHREYHISAARLGDDHTARRNTRQRQRRGDWAIRGGRRANPRSERRGEQGRSPERIPESRYPRTSSETGARVRFDIGGESPTSRTTSPGRSEHSNGDRDGDANDGGEEDAPEAGSGGTFFHGLGRTLN